MQSVPEAAAEGEGLPSAHQLRDWGYGDMQTHAQPDQGNKVRFCRAGLPTALFMDCLLLAGTESAPCCALSKQPVSACIVHAFRKLISMQETMHTLVWVLLL